jgi:hypothetical protein
MEHFGSNLMEPLREEVSHGPSAELLEQVCDVAENDSNHLFFKEDVAAARAGNKEAVLAYCEALEKNNGAGQAELAQKVRESYE